MLISICICTCGREHLRRTLESVGREALPAGAEAEILVIDNAPEGPAHGIVESTAASLTHPVRYVIEPRGGLSFARNRSLEAAKGDWLALIDDDETADPGWLGHLLSTAKRCEADAVVGRVLAVFEESPPLHVTASRMFDRRIPATGTTIGMGHALTGNALLRRSFIVEQALRFEEEFNRTGGEDSDFFRTLIDRGGRIVSCREAVVREVVPRSRMTTGYITNRALQVGETYARVMQRHGGLGAMALVAARASFNVAAAGSLTLVCRVAGLDAHYHYHMLMLRNLGKLRYLSGAAPIELYAENPGTAIVAWLSL